MTDRFLELDGVHALICAEDGPGLEDEPDVNDFLSLAWSHDAAILVVPMARLDETFFHLRSGAAGCIAQKFVNYRIILAILGDVSIWTAQSKAFHDYVFECNQGAAIWFVRDEDELRQRRQRLGYVTL